MVRRGRGRGDAPLFGVDDGLHSFSQLLVVEGGRRGLIGAAKEHVE